MAELKFFGKMCVSVPLSNRFDRRIKYNSYLNKNLVETKLNPNDLLILTTFRMFDILLA